MESVTPLKRHLAVNVSETLRARWESRLHLAYLNVYSSVDQLRSTLSARKDDKDCNARSSGISSGKSTPAVLAAEFNGKIVFDAVLSPEHVFRLRTGEQLADMLETEQLLFLDYCEMYFKTILFSKFVNLPLFKFIILKNLVKSSKKLDSVLKKPPTQTQYYIPNSDFERFP